MKIYDHQLTALGADRAAEFERRLVQFVQEQVGVPLAREVRPSDVRGQIAEAATWSLQTERQIAAFVIGVWTFGDDFRARIAPMRDTFADRGVAPDEKATLLNEVFDALWSAHAG